MDGLTLTVEIRSAGSVRTETRTLTEPPALMLNMARRLASAGLVAGATHQLMVFDPATLGNQPVTVRVHDREVVLTSGRPIPAFKVDLGYAGLTTTAWITDTGAIVREESPLGLMSVRESPEQAQQMAVSARVRSDMLQAAAIVPTLRVPVTEPTDVVAMRVEFSGVDLAGFDFAAATQTMNGRVLAVTDPRALVAGPADPDRLRFLGPETLIESDDPEIVEQARRIVGGATDARTKAERLVREVNAMLDKKPTVSLPSAKEVLRTKVGDCNEHTALYVALARAAGIPARINVGLAMVRGAFYYHAWPEVWIDEGPARGFWLPVDPTFNQFPADATHLRLLRGGLDKQAAILPLIGRLKMTVLEAEMLPNTSPVVVGRELADAADARPLSIALPARQACGCWALPCRGGSMIAVHDLRQGLRGVHRRGRRVARGAAGADSRLPRAERRRQDHHHPHDRRAAQAHGWPHPGRRARLGDRARSRQSRARLHSRSALHLREADRRRVPAFPRRPLRHAGRRGGDTRRRDARICSSWAAGRTSWSRASRTA